MSIARCSGCGSQKNPYDALCPSCGRGAWLSGLLQTGFIILLVGGLAFGSGLLRWRDVDRYLQFQGTPTQETAAVRSTGQYRGPTARPSARPVRSAAAFDSTRNAATRRTTTRIKRLVKGLLPCLVGDSVRYRTLASTHPEWDREVWAAVTCKQVRPGFTPEQLRAALGEPDSIARDEADVETWLYRNDRVTLSKGRVLDN